MTIVPDAVGNVISMKKTYGMSPNGDGVNDRFMVEINKQPGITEVTEFRIFNRWGEEVFKASDNSGWNGNIDGTEDNEGGIPAPMDIYYYFIKVSYNDGTVQEFKGELTLLR